MRGWQMTCAGLLVCLVCGQGYSAAVSAGVEVDDEGLKAFHVSIGEHYGEKEKAVVAVRGTHVTDQEIPVVYFLAKRAGVDKKKVLALRVKGKTWMEISVALGLDAGAFYVEAGDVKGPPYGNAYGHYKNKPKNKWNTIVLADDDIINLVNLRFMIDVHGLTAAEVIKLRSAGKHFANVHKELKEKKAKKTAETKAKKEDKPKPKKAGPKKGGKGKKGR